MTEPGRHCWSPEWFKIRQNEPAPAPPEASKIPVNKEQAKKCWSWRKEFHSPEWIERKKTTTYDWFASAYHAIVLAPYCAYIAIELLRVGVGPFCMASRALKTTWFDQWQLTRPQKQAHSRSIFASFILSASASALSNSRFSSLGASYWELYPCTTEGLWLSQSKDLSLSFLLLGCSWSTTTLPLLFLAFSPLCSLSPSTRKNRTVPAGCPYSHKVWK